MDDALIFLGIAAVAFLMNRRSPAGGVENARDALLERETSPSSVADFYDMDMIDTTLADITLADMDAYYSAPHNLPLFITTKDSALDFTSGGSPTGGTYTNVAFLGDLMKWTESKIPAQYLNAIRTVETRYSMPRNMMARLLYQESAYRPEIIDGSQSSPAGALGIAQFMPKTAAALGIDPLDPFQAIGASSKYLSDLKRKFGTWANALAAYNWGEGNLAAWLKTGYGVKGQPMPQETKLYFSQILADVGNGQVMA